MAPVPARMKRSVWKPAWKPPLLEKSGSPSAFSFSPYCARIVHTGRSAGGDPRPAGEHARELDHVAAGDRLVIATAGSDSVTRIGCWRWLTSVPRGPATSLAGAQALSSKPARSYPGRVSRAS